MNARAAIALLAIFLVEAAHAQQSASPGQAVNRPYTFNALENYRAGADIGVLINAQAARCSPNTPCNVSLPPGASYTYSTPIVLPNNTTLSCTNSSAISNSGGKGSPDNQLVFTGTDVALTMSGRGSRVKGCSLKLTSAYTRAGIVLSGVSNWVEDSSIEGGGPTTKLVWMSNVSGGAEDNHIVQSRISNFTGKAIYIDHCNDCLVDDVTAYGVHGNKTGVTLTVDSRAGGTTVHNLSGGDSGLHGLVVQNTLPGGGNPTWIFIDGLITDLSASDGWLFDRSLGGSNIGATIVNSWSAGSGGNGVRVSGGRIIAIVGGNKVRSNALNGIAVDSDLVGALLINDNQILGNNLSNTPGLSGVLVSAHADGVLVQGNVIGNSPEVGGHQTYGFFAAGDVDNLNFSFNNCSHNDVGCYNKGTVLSSKRTLFGNTDEADPFLGNEIPSTLAVNNQGAGESTLMPYTGSGRLGVGLNMHFDGKNYVFLSDGGSNGGGAVLTDFGTGVTDIVSVPSNHPIQGPQSIDPKDILKSSVFRFGPSAVTALKPLSMPADSKIGSLEIPGISGSPATNHVVCWKTNASMGYCSTKPDESGACNCL